MADIQVTWEEAAASVGVPAHGSYNLERALKDSGYVTFEYDFEYLDSGGYRILDKRVKASKGPWFVNGQMEAEDWGVLRPAALEAVAEMRKVRRILNERVRKLQATYGYRLHYANNHGRILPLPSGDEEEKLYAELRPNSDVGRKVAERKEHTLESEERAKALRQARHDLQFREDEVERTGRRMRMFVKADPSFTQADASEIMERLEDNLEAAQKHLAQLEGATLDDAVVVKTVTEGTSSTTATWERLQRDRIHKSKVRDDRILVAMRLYDGRYGKRRGRPFLRPLSAHAGFKITRHERNRLWPTIAKERAESKET